MSAEPTPYLEDDDEDVDIFDVVDPEWEAEQDRLAEADIAAGRVISNEAVMRWVKSWGTDNPLPKPKCGE